MRCGGSSIVLSRDLRLVESIQTNGRMKPTERRSSPRKASHRSGCGLRRARAAVWTAVEGREASVVRFVMEGVVREPGAPSLARIVDPALAGPERQRGKR